MDSKTPGLVATGEYCICGGVIMRLDRRPVKAQQEFAGPFCANCGSHGKTLRRRLFIGLDKGAAARALRLWQREEQLAARFYPTLCLGVGQVAPETTGDLRLLVAEVDEKALCLAMHTLTTAQDRRAEAAEQSGGPKRLRVREAAILIDIVTPHIALSALARLLGRHWAALVWDKAQPATEVDIVATRLGREGCGHSAPAPPQEAAKIVAIQPGSEGQGLGAPPAPQEAEPATATTHAPAVDTAVAALRRTDWGVELAQDSTYILRSPQQDLLALPGEALVRATPLVEAQPYACAATVAQLLQLPGALRLDPVPFRCPPWPQLGAPHIYGHHRGARNVEAPLHIWRPMPRGRSKERHVTLCGIVMTEAPGKVDLATPGLRICRDCCRVLVAVRTGAVQTPEPPKPVELSAWSWERNTRNVGALGYWRLLNRATKYATSEVPDPQEAVDRAFAKLRQLLRQATQGGVQDTESAAGVLRAYGWPIERSEGSWRLTDSRGTQQTHMEDTALVRVAQALRMRPDRTFDELMAVSAPGRAMSPEYSDTMEQ